MLDRHKDAVYRQIARACGNYDDAQDVLAETLMAAYRAMDQVREPEAMRAWLATIGRRICRRLRQKEAVAPILRLLEQEEPSILPDFDERIEVGRIKDCVKHALDSLPNEYREVYVLREIEGMSGEAAAKRLRISLPSLKSRLHRARKLIRRALDEGLCGT